MPFPSYVCVAFTNPEMTRRIREERDLAVRVIGRCVEALVVNKLRADIHSRNIPVSDADLKLASLSTILGSETRDVMLLLRHPGGIEFTTMVFLALDNFYSFTLETVPLDVLRDVQGTFSILSDALPARLTNTLMSVSEGQCDLAF